LKLLIAGGSGFIGGRLREWLGQQGRHDVVIGTRDPARHAVSQPSMALDWGSDASLEAACLGMDAVVHVSGMNAAGAAADPSAALAAYGEGTARLARAAAKRGVSRLLYVSSAHVYGEALSGVVDESVAPRPRHPYALGHAAAEDALRAAPANLRCVIVRLANSFGAPMELGTDCWSLLANDLSRQAVGSRKLMLRTAGTQRRDFIAITEACRAIVHLLELDDTHLGEGLFNLGGGARSVLDVARCVQARVAALLGFTPALIAGEGRDHVGGELTEYSAARLRDSGFAANGDAFQAELDRLISYCASHA
jgi:UDP-glucose 4-epimerase